MVVIVCIAWRVYADSPYQLCNQDGCDVHNVMLMGWTRISFKPPQYSDLDSVSRAPTQAFMGTG